MTRTAFLTTMIVVVMAMHYFPAHAAIISSLAIAFGALYLAILALRKYPRAFRDRKRAADQAAADEKEYWDYKGGLDAIRARHDSNNNWAEFAPPSPAYQAELDDLHARHQPMLDRRFGALEPPKSVGRGAD